MLFLYSIKFADDTTAVDLICKNDESACRDEVQQPTDWCRANNLSLNVDKIKEMVVAFKITWNNHTHLNTESASMQIVKEHRIPSCSIGRNP